ncbi:MAG: alpha-hydroxy acid oxidase [Gemmatimonadales bacterium]
MRPVNLIDYEHVARDVLADGPFGYIAGGAGDELTLRANRTAFDRFRLRPRVLIDVSRVDARTTVLGQKVSFPVLLAPTGFQRLAHSDGELATARAAAKAQTIMVSSTMSSVTLEDIAAASHGPKWFQLYCYRDKEVTRSLVERAAASGYSALCITVDVPRLGRRERDERNSVRLPPEALPVNLAAMVDLAAIPLEERGSAVSQYAADLIDPSLTWDDIDWLRSLTDLPVLLKGILTAEDAEIATQHGAAGIVVSNHGGRQLDGVPATIEVLEEVVRAVGGRAEVLLDGGVRRGTDVLKALALGARAVLIGRPYVWGLAADGEAGVTRVLELLRDEVELAMALLGCPAVADISGDHVGQGVPIEQVDS